MQQRKIGDQKPTARARFPLPFRNRAAQRIARPAKDAREFILQNGLREVIDFASKFAEEHFGDRLVSLRETLYTSDAAEQSVELEIGIRTSRGAFLADRAEFLDRLDTAGPEYDPDKLLIAVRARASAE
jgi:hypothetical protein